MPHIIVVVSSFGDTCRNLLIWGLSQLLRSRVILSLWTQLRGGLSATFMLTCSISSSYPAVILNPAKDTILWCWMEWEGSGRSIWPPWPHHNSAGSRSQKYALNFGRSQIIYHPAHAHAMCFLCFLPYHTLPFCHLQPYF